MATKKQKELREIVGGMDLREPDDRDFSYYGVFGAIDISAIPNVDWLTGNIIVKDQLATDMCTGFGLAAVREDQEDIGLSPEWLFAQIKKLRGDPLAWGGDLNSGCKVMQEIGAIELSQAPFNVKTKDRNFLAQAKNWPDLTKKAEVHKAKSFFRVDGPYDTFDNIRAALWANREARRSIYTGCLWRPGWTFAPKGIIPATINPGGVGHCFKIANGQKIINGKPYLIIQNSAGTDSGDAGLYYMSREVANRDLKFGQYMFIDMPVEVAKNLNGEWVREQNKPFLAKLWELFTEHFTL